jgi:HK97 family phage prohead protease
MPYFISDQTDCPEWAVVKDDDSVVACHDTKNDAIAQMVALSLAEDIEPGGERKIHKKKLKYRAEPDELEVGDFVRWGAGDNVAQGRITRIVRDGEIDVPDSSFTITGTPEDPAALIRIYRQGEDGWNETDTLVGHKFSTLSKIDELRAVTRELPDNYRPALAEDVPEGRACGNCFFYNEARVNDEGDKAWCERWEDFVDGAFYCNAWEPDEEGRDIDQDAPAYMRAAARRGLELHEQGLSGDGVTAGTIREARLMADGQISDDKWIRIAAWIARHLVDLDSPDADPDSDNYPSAGVVAHLLWGSGPTKRAAQRTKDYADSVVARIRQEETNSMETKNKWLKVARAIQLKIDGPQPDSKEPEVRTNNVDFEVRSEGDGMTFTGYASVFNSPSEDLGGFVEYVAPGAFKRSLQSRNEVKLLWNHDSGEPLASLRGGTMQLVEDSVGLKVTAQLPNTTRGRDIAELLRTNVIDSMSFGFNVIKDSWSSNGQTRTLESVRLFEVSVVSFPAYEATVAQVRSAPSINADELADALLKLESGEELDEKNANLITEVVSKLKAQPEVQEAEDNGLGILDLKQKQFDLLMKRI